MMSISQMTTAELYEALASSEPIPGGGAAAALCGSLGAALGGMVSRLSLVKAGEEARGELDGLLQESETLRRRLLELADADGEAFLPLSKAYSIPKDQPGRDDLLENCLKKAAAVPMEILELCCQAIVIHERLAKLSSPLVVSDAGTGAVLAWGAMYAAAMSVLANTRLMKDRETAQELNRRAEELMGEYWQRADKTYEDVFQTLRGRE